MAIKSRERSRESGRSGEVKRKKGKKESMDRQLKTIVIWMAVIVIIFFVFYTLFQNISKIEYKGLTFKKVKVGELPFYHYSYIFKIGDEYARYNLFIRNDPRKNKVPVEGEIDFNPERFVYISINSTGIAECKMSSVAISALTDFLASNQFIVSSGTPDEAEAKAANSDYVSCAVHPHEGDSIIAIQAGNSTYIKREDNCYVMSISNCEIIEAVEKFEVQAIIDGQERAKTAAQTNILVTSTGGAN